MSDAVSLGIKGRWVRFGRFAAADIEWERLRSHASQLRLDGSEPVTFRIRRRRALVRGRQLGYAVYVLIEQYGSPFVFPSAGGS